MANQWEKIREHPRVFFSPGDGLTAVFSVAGISDPIPARILDMSLGGIGCFTRRDDRLVLKDKGRLMLAGIDNADNLKIAASMAVEVRWIIDHAEFGHIGFGCRFLDTPEPVRRQIADFLNRVMAAGRQMLDAFDSKHYVKDSIS